MYALSEDSSLMQQFKKLYYYITENKLQYSSKRGMFGRQGIGIFSGIPNLDKFESFEISLTKHFKDKKLVGYELRDAIGLLINNLIVR